MQSLAMWEQILLGVMVVLILFWFGPGIKTTLKQSREAESDWPGLLKPIAVVVVAVILMIMMVA